MRVAVVLLVGLFGSSCYELERSSGLGEGGIPAVGESAADVRERVHELFTRVKAELFADVFDETDRIKLDDESLVYVVGELQTYAVLEADRDAVGDAFELFCKR